MLDLFFGTAKNIKQPGDGFTKLFLMNLWMNKLNLTHFPFNEHKVISLLEALPRSYDSVFTEATL